MVIINGDDGDNELTGTEDADVINGGGGNDKIDGKGGNDVIDGGAGDDQIIAGDGFDTVDGGSGNDVISGGGDNDVLSGGADADTIRVNSLGSSGINNTTVNGGSSGDDDDTLNIGGLLGQGYEVMFHVQNPEFDGAPGFNGQITLFNPSTNQWANVNYTDIEHVITCFTPGTMIATPEGERAVEELEPGERVITRDTGVQKIAWVGKRVLSKEELAAKPAFWPVRIAAGALGGGLPERDMEVSPQHRVLMMSDDTVVWFETREVLAAAVHLVGRKGITRGCPEGPVSYIHIMFDRHELVLSDGTWTESFQPGDHSMAGLDDDQRAEILAIFPELARPEGRVAYVAARRVLKRHESALLVQ